MASKFLTLAYSHYEKDFGKMVSAIETNNRDQAYGIQIFDISGKYKRVGVLGQNFLSSFSKDQQDWHPIGKYWKAKSYFKMTRYYNSITCLGDAFQDILD